MFLSVFALQLGGWEAQGSAQRVMRPLITTPLRLRRPEPTTTARGVGSLSWE